MRAAQFTTLPSAVYSRDSHSILTDDIQGCCMSSPSPSDPSSSDNDNDILHQARQSQPRQQPQTQTPSLHPSQISSHSIPLPLTLPHTNQPPSITTSAAYQQQQQHPPSSPPHSPHTPSSARRTTAHTHGSPSSPHATSPIAPGVAAVAPSGIQAPRPWRSGRRSWTRVALARERAAFFDTQTSGRGEVWAAIRLAVESMRDSVSGEGGMMSREGPGAFGEGAMAEGRGILEAAGVSCPTGRLANGVWDESGVWYEVPWWVVRDPVNVVDGDADGEKAEEGDADEPADEEDEGSGRNASGEGKKEMVRVRARLSDRASDVVVKVERSATVRVVVRRVHEAAKIPNDTRIKLAYLGKVLKNDEPLVAQGWQDKHVVNALVFLRPWELDDEKGVASSP